MSARPKRCIDKLNYRELADVKLPKQSCIGSAKASSSSGSSDLLVLYRLKVIERDGDRVKVRYIEYGSKYDEWRRKDDLIVLDDDDEIDLNDAVPSAGSIQLATLFSLFEELACNIKSSLSSQRKGDRCCCIDMRFDSLHFEALAHRGAKKSKRGKIVVYGLSSLSKLNDILGTRWFVRGLNKAGDFCYVEPGIVVRFYLKPQKKKVDYQLQEDGTMETHYFGANHYLNFKFVKRDGVVTEWSSVISLSTSYYLEFRLQRIFKHMYT